MSSKKFLFIFLSFTLISYIGIYILYMLINPNQIFNNSITAKKFFYTKNYSKKQFELLKYKKYNLIFGTSQSHMIGTKMMNDDTLNFHNLYAEPGDIINFLKQLDKKQINNIKQIIYLIDLRAGAHRIDSNLVDYNSDLSIEGLTLESLKRIFLDIKYNILKNYTSFLELDGSVNAIDENKSVKNIPSYGKSNSSKLEYNSLLVKNIALINKFSDEHDIKIKYITPVTNNKYFYVIDLDNLYIFYEELINRGVSNISLYYFISELSNPTNGNNYNTFHNNEHLNYKAVKLWLYTYILNDNDEFLIKNKNDLKKVFKYLRNTQKTN